jgi:heat shock protein HtpX
VNTLKTGILLAAIGGLAVAIGSYFFGANGAVIGLGLAFLVQGFAYFNGHKLALRFAHAEPLQPGALPWYENAAQELSQRAGIPTPQLYLSPDPQPNAFAAGRNPQVAVVCVNQGLLDLMPRQQVIAVLAHEIGHIKNRDTLIMTVAAAMASFISMLANFAFFIPRGDNEDRNPFVDILMMLLAPISATLIQMAISRAREFEADRAAAELMGDARPMMDALASLERGTHSVPSYTAQPSTAHMYIAAPFSGGGIFKLFMTHPPIEERIQSLARLRNQNAA